MDKTFRMEIFNGDCSLIQDSSVVSGRVRTSVHKPGDRLKTTTVDKSRSCSINMMNTEEFCKAQVRMDQASEIEYEQFYFLNIMETTTLKIPLSK